MRKAQMIQRAERELREALLRDEAVEAEEKRVQAERAATQAEVTKRQAILEWVRELDDPEEHVPAPAPPSPQASVPEAPAEIPQTERVRLAVKELGGEASNTEIGERLPDLNATQIRSAVKYNAKRGKLVSAGYGRWRLPVAVTAGQYASAPAVQMNGAAVPSYQEGQSHG